MDLINDLGTDLALAFLADEQYRDKIASEEALALIRRIKSVLEPLSADAEGQDVTLNEESPLDRSCH